MEESEGYEGLERRKSNLELDEALLKVQKLHNAAETLANAVANTAHRSELESLRVEIQDENKRRTYISAGLAAAVVIILIFAFSIKISNLNKSVKHGHEVITCMQGKPEAQRTGDLYATALVTCEQTTK